MKKCYFLAAAAMLMLGSCTQDGDTIYQEIDPPTLNIDDVRSDLIEMTVEGKDVTFSWPMLPEGLSMVVDVVKEGTTVQRETYARDVTSFIQKDLDSNVRFAYVFRVTDGTLYSDGIVKTYTRPGATAPAEVAVAQREGAEGYEAVLTWAPLTDADEVQIDITKGGDIENVIVDGNAVSYTYKGVADGDEISFSLVARNELGESLPVSTSLKAGKTAVAFVSYYATPEELVQNGDDDEASAWLWFHSEYPNSRYLYFGDIKSADDLKDLRVLFYIRDLDNGSENDVWNQPACVQDATPFVTEWYRNGGNILLWQHACTYVGDLGRIDKNLLMSNDRRITTGKGFFSNDRWYMAVCANLAGRYYIDYSKHPIYNGVAVNSNKTITVKGRCWTEDHNCCFFNIPSALTGMHNQSADTYKVLTDTYGIYPLATWDNEQMNFVSMLNVWEAQQGNTDFKGTVLCMGNGGLEFSYKNDDATPDISAYPMNNPYHGNILKIARNAIEYLKTR